MCCSHWKSDLTCTSVMSHLLYEHGNPSVYFLFFFKQISELYESSPWSSYHLHSGITAFRYAALTKSLLKREKCMATTHSSVHRLQNSNIVNPLCVTVKEQKGSTSSTGVNSPPRTTLPWRSGGPAHRGCSAGSLAATRCCGTAATSRAITWSGTTTCSTCWVEALTHIQYMHIKHRNVFLFPEVSIF